MGGTAFLGGPDQGELACPAHHMVLETTSQNQGSEFNQKGSITLTADRVLPLPFPKGHTAACSKVMITTTQTPETSLQGTSHWVVRKWYAAVLRFQATLSKCFTPSSPSQSCMHHASAQRVHISDQSPYVQVSGMTPNPPKMRMKMHVRGISQPPWRCRALWLWA